MLKYSKVRYIQIINVNIKLDRFSIIFLIKDVNLLKIVIKMEIMAMLNWIALPNCQKHLTKNNQENLPIIEKILEIVNVKNY